MKQKTNKAYKKIVLAYSGGLDTSIIIPWLKENYPGCEVIAVSGNVGQVGELDGLEEKALKTGASKLYVEDLNKEFIEEVVIPSMQMGAKYENTYLLGTSFARPIIAKRLVEIAKAEGADAICHGCTGKGNDQVRFELAIKAFAPDMPVIAPWRIWDIKGRDEEIDYAEAHNIPLKISRETNYSKDKNMWHLSHEGLELEDPANEPKYAGNMEMGVTPEEAPDEGEYVTIDFEKGWPVAVNGEKMAPVDLVWKLNELGGKHGIGIIDIVENRLVGIKCRGVYETPGGTILYHAHEMLEQLCLDKATQHYKQRMALEYADLVYNGQWFSLPAARGHDRLLRKDPADRHRHREAQALQGQHHRRGHDQPLQPLRPGDRHLRRGQRVRPDLGRRLHHPLRPAHRGVRQDEGQERPVSGAARPCARWGRATWRPPTATPRTRRTQGT